MNIKIGAIIKKLRAENNITQDVLATAIGVTPQAISRWEGATAQPDVANVLQLSKLFGVTTDYLLNDEYESDYDLPRVNYESIVVLKVGYGRNIWCNQVYFKEEVKR